MIQTGYGGLAKTGMWGSCYAYGSNPAPATNFKTDFLVGFFVSEIPRVKELNCLQFEASLKAISNQKLG